MGVFACAVHVRSQLQCSLTHVLLLLHPAGVQPYVINGAKVLFLRSRPQPRAPKATSAPSRYVLDAMQRTVPNSLDITAPLCSSLLVSCAETPTHSSNT